MRELMAESCDDMASCRRRTRRPIQGKFPGQTNREIKQGLTELRDQLQLLSELKTSFPNLVGLSDIFSGRNLDRARSGAKPPLSPIDKAPSPAVDVAILVSGSPDAALPTSASDWLAILRRSPARGYSWT